ncbi:hypothetical protein LTR67_004239 [Exophiala xenobiotica]
MAATQSKKKMLIHGPLKKSEGSLQAVESNHTISTIHFALQQDQDQRVTVFDSSITPEPFLDSVALERLRKRQQMDEEQVARDAV